MDQRDGFIAEHCHGLYRRTELCEWYGVSRKTGYKWMARFGARGPSSAPGSESNAEAVARTRSRRRSRHSCATQAAFVPPVVEPTERETVAGRLRRAVRVRRGRGAWRNTGAGRSAGDAAGGRGGDADLTTCSAPDRRHIRIDARLPRAYIRAAVSMKEL